ncbi:MULTISPECIES: hypothetical protein [Streptomyces]|uniref:Uncharacterized protein n=1 Tax=Streptomyces tsukubensis (strain DSM 42081 / NBRC 108919 / NRRL 18488 / 9993) TaxID=1114943 RepID=I2N7X9_STRT9|nr:MULTISPECIES: hypothetical protein [Streptomyces]AZK97037.1 hypothetical protein B7R87_26580 [Streptomyces tsukubensis]EIF93126.1 hypothetical protein [Streptomyces tsukubensis NRRL18488]MYS66523.1 hypothetical protein [Streptomyces sp. SID5473]QKM66988.1 hypothetical protein STSU_007200 [Streptomyces tsukubensis NRRL18488]TAI41534.1 hypothetical protein EWI31_27250 [Streptomyces tsukubensis]
MIAFLWERSLSAYLPVEEALGRALSDDSGSGQELVVAYWDRLGDYTQGEERHWTPVDWINHLDDPTFEWPFATDNLGVREPVFHLSVDLHPADRDLGSAEWATIAHRLAITAGLAPPLDDQGCQWVAFQARPRRLDLLANLIRLDGAWQQLPADPLRAVMNQIRRVEHDFRLIPAHPATPPPAPPTAPPTRGPGRR